MRLAADIETNGLLRTVSTFHCAVAIDLDTREVHKFRPGEMNKFLKLTEAADLVVYHNGVKYDHPALEKLSSRKIREDNIQDTMVLSRLIFPNLAENDFGRTRRYRQVKEIKEKLEAARGVTPTEETKRYIRAGDMSLKQFEGKAVLPPKLTGSHSLKAWGYRLQEFKDDFGAETDWQTYSEDMLDYCEQDVWVTVRLFEMLTSKGYSETAIELEHDIAWLMARQERNGFYFDVRNAERLEMELRGKQAKYERQLKETFGSWYQFVSEKTPKKSLKYKDPMKASRVEGAPFSEVKLVEFNPGSRQHIAKVMQELGWKPEVFTETGQPQVDEDTLSSLKYPEAQLCVDYLTVNKRLGQLADGDQAWLKAVTPEGFIHGSVNTNAAVTGRATHSSPNVAQVPSGKALYGPECRELFTVPKGWSLFGSDASGLELRCLGHFMAKWDDGAYIKELLEGDIHTANQNAAGLPSRDTAKTFIYGYLYGAGVEKIGSIVEPLADSKTKKTIGTRLRKKFLDNIPAIKHLRDAVKSACAKGFLKGLDGRKLHIRSEHAALNTLLQSAGALICKKWCIEIERLAQEKGLRHGWNGDYAFCAWVHEHRAR